MSDTDEHAHLEELLATYQRNLQLLEKQAASFGGEGNVPVSVWNQLRDTRTQIAELQTKLGSADLSSSGTTVGDIDLREKLFLEPVPVVPYFVGRERELTLYRERLRRDRFVIITGMAGVGKTVLGAKLARGEAEREDQIFWYRFNSIAKNTADALFWSLAVFLESRGHPDPLRYMKGEIRTQKPLERTVKLDVFRAALSGDDYLLCFDEFQVVKNVPDVAHFFSLIEERYEGQWQDLSARFIIMGREVSAEIEYLSSDSLEGFAEEEARIFVADRNLQLPPALLQLLWRRTRGNAKMLDLSVAALATMGGNLEAKESFIRAMVRGKILKYVMNEIYATLPLQAQIVLGALSIFPAPIQREVVEEILAPEEVLDVRFLIDVLVNKHIVNEAEQHRIDCHDLVREYCYQRLSSKNKKLLHQRAADYYEQQTDYLAAAFHHYEQGALGQALDLLTGHARDIINTGGAGALVEQLARFERRRLNSGQWVALCRARGEGHEMRGEYPRALEAYRAALEGATGEEARAELLLVLGRTYGDLWEHERAIEYCTQSLRISESLEDRKGIADAHLILGWAYYQLDQLKRAREHFTVSQDIGREMGDKLLLAKANLRLGVIDLWEGQLKQAQKRIEESQRTFRVFGEQVWEAKALGNLGLVYRERGDTNSELSYYQQSVVIEEEIGDVENLRLDLNNLGDLYRRLGDHPKAVHYYDRLVQLTQDARHTRFLSWAYSRLADAHLAMGDLQLAWEYAKKARQVAKDIGPGVELGVSYRALGDVYLALGDVIQAKAYFEQSILLLEETKEDEDLRQARLGLDKAHARLDDDSASQEEDTNHAQTDPFKQE